MRDAYRAKRNATTLAGAGFPPALAATAGRPFRARRRKSGRARHAAGALAALALALACLFGGAPDAGAQTVETLVSNANQTTADIGSSSDRAQAFTTGSSTLGYTLSSVEIDSRDRDANDAAVSVCTVDASGHPTSSCTALTAPSSFAAGPLVFTAPADTRLAPNTTYTLLITSPGGENLALAATNSDSEDSGAAHGWSIANAFHQRAAAGGWDTAILSLTLKITIKGFANSLETIDSNLNQDRDDFALVGDYFGTRHATAQAFTTGPNAQGYPLHAVDVRFQYIAPGATPEVSVCTADGSGNLTRSAICFTLTNPSGLSGWTRLAFTAPANTVLSSNTTYFVVFEETTTLGYAVFATRSGAQAGGRNFSIHDGRLSKPESADWEDSSARDTTLGIAIRGAVPPLPSLSIEAPDSVDEGEDASFTVTLSAASLQLVTVDYATHEGGGEEDDAEATSGVDFTPASGRLTFLPGETSKTITVPTREDNRDEFKEAFTLTLSRPIYAEIADGTAVADIEDDDSEPLVIAQDLGAIAGDGTIIGVVIDGVSYFSVVEEGGDAYFEVVLGSASGKTVTVDFRTTLTSVLANYTANADDFVARSGTLTFAPGETQKLVAVATLRDARDEGTETFGFELLNPVNATIDSFDVPGTIRNAAPPGDERITSVQVTSDPNDDDREGDDGTYAIGDEIEVTVSFTDSVEVFNGTPQLALDIGGVTRLAEPRRYPCPSYAIQSRECGRFRNTFAGTLLFYYTVQEGDEAPEGPVVPANALRLNGSEIKTARRYFYVQPGYTVATVEGGEAVDTGYHRIDAGTGHKVDGVRPTMVSGAVSADGNSIGLNSSETVTELPRANRSNYRVYGLHRVFTDHAAMPPSATVSDDGVDLELPRRYRPVRPGRDVSVFVRDGTFADAAGNANADHRVSVENGVPQTRRLGIHAMAITSDPGSDGRYAAGEHIEVTATFGTAMWVNDGPPRLRVHLGQRLGGGWRWAYYVRGSGTPDLVFRYRVRQGEEALSERVWIPFNSIRLNMKNTASIRDALGDAADLAHGDVPGPWEGDRPRPTGAFRNLPPQHNSPFDFEVVFSEPIAIARAAMIEHVFEVTNGRVSAAVRLDNEHDEADGLVPNREWRITVDSFSDEAVTVVLPETTDCDAEGAVCTPDRRPLTGEIRAVVPGPATQTGLTAAFADVPRSHGGADFKFKVQFSEAFKLRWRTMLESALRVENGHVTAARRLDNPHHDADGLEPNREWEVTVAPDAGAGDVTVTLPEPGACGATVGATVCTEDGRPLSAAVSATVPRVPVVTAPARSPLTARFANAPGEHDGETAFTFEVHYSEPFGLRWRTMLQTALRVTNGRVTGARRLDNPHHDEDGLQPNRSWRVTVKPSGTGDVTVVLPRTADCSASGAVCTGDGRMLSHPTLLRVMGPPSLGVADASVTEAEGATLDFAVTMSRAASETVTVDWATSDGSATAGSDYTADSGTLTFKAGETSKTVSVSVLDDAVNEGAETMTLTLSNVSGAGVWLSDATATGTIENSDPLQKMWLSRFGRTVADHVTAAVSDRLANPLSGAQVTVGGQSVDLAATEDHAALTQALSALARAFGAPAGPEGDPGSGDGPDGFGAGPGVGGSADAGSAPGRVPSGRELLLGSAFHLAAGGDGAGPGLAAWGRVSAGGFDGEHADDTGRLRVDGEVVTGILGADAEWRRLLAGVAVSVSEGEGTFGGTHAGAVESTMTAVSPYARFMVNDRVSVWGLAGWGAGAMTMTEHATDERAEVVTKTDLSMQLAALGGRGELLKQDEAGGYDLAVKADAFFVRTEWDRVSEETDTAADASRVRLILEGGRAFDMGGGAALRPSLELGLRHDGGDAETGTGVELGAGVSYQDPSSGLSVEAKARMLVAHADSDYEEWGVSGSVRLAPGERGRGLSFSLAPTLGAASSAAERLWGARDAGGLAPDGTFEAGRGLAGELGYGLALFGDRFTGTPNLGFGLSDNARDWRIGWRLTSAVPGDPGFQIDLDATRREAANGNAPPGHGVMLRGAVRW